MIRIIGNYGKEQETDEYDEKIKEKQEEMVGLIAENAKEGTYSDVFDRRYRKIAEEINELKEKLLQYFVPLFNRLSHLHTTFFFPFLAHVTRRYCCPHSPHISIPVNAYVEEYLLF